MTRRDRMKSAESSKESEEILTPVVPVVAYSRALVADDDPEILEAVADALAHLGFEVVRADSGAGLVDQLAMQGPFDLIVSDISMPWMDGLKALRCMRSAGLGTPVIVMTALRDDIVKTQVQAMGSNVVLLLKPFGLKELETAVTALTSALRPTESRPH